MQGARDEGSGGDSALDWTFDPDTTNMKLVARGGELVVSVVHVSEEDETNRSVVQGACDVGLRDVSALEWTFDPDTTNIKLVAR